MVLIGNLQSWVESARAAVQVLRAQNAPPPSRQAAPPVPALTSGRTGLRGLEHTQDVEAVEAKGLIIDRYL